SPPFALFSVYFVCSVVVPKLRRDGANHGVRGTHGRIELPCVPFAACLIPLRRSYRLRPPMIEPNSPRVISLPTVLLTLRTMVFVNVVARLSPRGLVFPKIAPMSPP